MFRPWELAIMTFREVMLAIEGLRDKNKYWHDLMRHQTLIIAGSGIGGKEICKKFPTLWPVEGEKQSNSTIRDRALKTLAEFKKAEQQQSDKQKVKQILDGRGAKDNSRG